MIFEVKIMEQRYNLFTGLILNISRCLQKIKNEEMSNYGLKGKQVQCLFTLYNSDNGATLTQLCEQCDEDKGAMSRTVGELTKSGLVFCEESEDRKYRNPIKLTQKGKSFGKVVADKISDILGVASEGVSDKDRDVLYATLTCISNNLSQICKKYGVKKHD